jgi:transposase
LTNQIAFILDAPGESDQDRNENRQRLVQLRTERALHQKRIAEIEDAAQRPTETPTLEEVQMMIADLGTRLKTAAHSSDPAELAALREIIVNMTGGRILLTQQGLRKKNNGWLRASFDVRPPSSLLPHPALLGDDLGEAIHVEIDLKRRSNRELQMEKVKKLYDLGRMNIEIAEELGMDRKRVTLLLRAWAESHGESFTDGRRRRKYLERKQLKQPRYQTLAEEAKRLWGENLSVSEIAKRLQCSRPTVHVAVGYWYESRDLPVPSPSSRRERIFEEAKRLFNEGCEIQQIAATFSYSPDGMREFLKRGFEKRGLEFPDRRSRQKGVLVAEQQAVG